MKTASEMTSIVSGGALNSTQTKPRLVAEKKSKGSVEFLRRLRGVVWGINFFRRRHTRDSTSTTSRCFFDDVGHYAHHSRPQSLKNVPGGTDVLGK